MLKITLECSEQVDQSYNYTREKLTTSIRLLTLGSGDIKQRLIEAYMQFQVLQERDFPEHLRADYIWIRSSLLKKPALKAKGGTQNISSSIEQTLHFMRRQPCVEIAKRIVQLNESLATFNNNDDIKQ
jgi:hypothetical protein